MKFIETSAKSAINVDEAFMTMTQEIIQIKKKSHEQEMNKRKDIININDSQNIQKSDKKCC